MTPRSNSSLRWRPFDALADPLRSFPATLATALVTAIATSLQFAFPPILTALRRNPERLAAGEWWRIVTPLFVHPEGLHQIAFNFTALAILGPIMERRLGARRWLVVYLLTGLVGTMAGYAWHPYSAGASVAVTGLGGAWIGYMCARTATSPIRVGAAATIVIAFVLIAVRDVHGPPLLAGEALGYWFGADASTRT
jgi:rhomboid protease GluP